MKNRKAIINFQNLIVNEDPKSGFVEIANDGQFKKIEKIVDLYYGIDSKLMENTTN
jgi:hypothetical protein